MMMMYVSSVTDKMPFARVSGERERDERCESLDQAPLQRGER
jgi:hypothetical protein